MCGFATRLVVVSSLLQHVGWVHAQLAVNGVVTTRLFESQSVVETAYAPARHYASRFSHSCWGFSKYVYNLVSSEDKYSMCWLCKLLENGLVKWWFSKMVKRNWQTCLQMLLQLQIVLPSSSIHGKREVVSFSGSMEVILLMQNVTRHLHVVSRGCKGEGCQRRRDRGPEGERQSAENQS